MAEAAEVLLREDLGVMIVNKHMCGYF